MISAILSVLLASLFIGVVLISPMPIISILFILMIGWLWLKKARNDYFLSIRDKQLELFRLGYTGYLPFLTYQKK
ncbi:hypothetical protein D3T74_11270 [Salmonella enterica subsp. enterica]|nr:hypothetical protein D8S86_17185 [Salmonella enterica subsp. enterica serovar Mbandaka]AYJ64757.1 hypothetical protein D8S90_17195 [Salmonella enterica subsp. enterica serovar Lubbock]EAM9526173.1 hypothetical protein [Salmonella enterica]EAN0674766.1 hypothetical protein [Salmonella enterica subsp. enterica]EBC9815574.1 hypothetical protein [Salmonella enterica subsp. enterica serovar Montevideo]EBH9556760.1 hypothetical protein [Salmonella enterica subsp. enterica serovar Cerro]OUR42646.